MLFSENEGDDSRKHDLHHNAAKKKNIVFGSDW